MPKLRLKQLFFEEVGVALREAEECGYKICFQVVECPNSNQKNLLVIKHLRQRGIEYIKEYNGVAQEVLIRLARATNKRHICLSSKYECTLELAIAQQMLGFQVFILAVDDAVGGE